MAELLKGLPVVKELNETIKTEAAALKEKGIVPTLAILRVGEREDDISYENGAVKRCETTGVEVKRFLLPADVSEAKLLATIGEINEDSSLHGLLLFRPLPKHIDEEKVCNSIRPEKDIDGVTAVSLAGVFAGLDAGFPPCTPAACMELLDYYAIPVEGQKVCVIGRSLVVGKPAAMMLLKRNGTVTICHTRTKDLKKTCQSADILVVSAGVMAMIDESFLSPGQIVLDVGIHVNEEGKLAGDVAKEAYDIPAKITPVPGGIGTVTTSVLVKHVVEAAKRVSFLTNL